VIIKTIVNLINKTYLFIETTHFFMATMTWKRLHIDPNDNMKNNKFIPGAKNTFDDYNIQILQRNKK